MIHALSKKWNVKFYFLGFVKGFQDTSLKSILWSDLNTKRVDLDFQSQQVKGNISKNCRKVMRNHLYLWLDLMHDLWQIRPLFTWSKWNMGQILAFLA